MPDGVSTLSREDERYEAAADNALAPMDVALDDLSSVLKSIAATTPNSIDVEERLEEAAHFVNEAIDRIKCAKLDV